MSNTNQIKGIDTIRDSDWRTYEVLVKATETPVAGQTFRAWPWGESTYRTEGLEKTSILLSRINELIDGGFIKLVAPKRLVVKEA